MSKKPLTKLQELILKKEFRDWSDENAPFLEDLHSLLNRMILFHMEHDVNITYKMENMNKDIKQKILITCDWKMKDQSFEIVFDGEYYFGDSEVSVLDSLIKATDLERQDVIITRDYDLKKLKEITKDHNSDAVYNYQMFTVPEEFIDDLTNLKQERDE